MTSLPDWPRLMKAPLAAAYVGVSETSFRSLVDEGYIKRPKRIKGHVLWDRMDLDDYSNNLPQEGEPAKLRPVESISL